MLVLMLVPVAWTLFWVLLRLFLTSRLSPRERGTVIDGMWRDADQPTPIRPGPSRPPCGRPAAHVFLRLFGNEADCRHCAQQLEAQESAEREAAVREAERQLGRGGDHPRTP